MWKINKKIVKTAWKNQWELLRNCDYSGTIREKDIGTV